VVLQGAGGLDSDLQSSCVKHLEGCPSSDADNDCVATGEAINDLGCTHLWCFEVGRNEDGTAELDGNSSLISKVLACRGEGEVMWWGASEDEHGDCCELHARCEQSWGEYATMNSMEMQETRRAGLL
jgi:hypothetical protein